MPRTGLSTRDKILQAASRLFYAEGIRAVSVDAVAEKAGVTKRTLYYHFTSKDELIAGYLSERDQPNLALFRRWFTEGEGDVAAKVAAMFTALAKSARHPKWKGCGFLRTSAELANLPGHPAMTIGRAHKHGFEDWLAGELSRAGVGDAAALACQIRLLLDGAFAAGLLHRDSRFFDAAGAASVTLVRAAMASQPPMPKGNTSSGSRSNDDCAVT